ncbi:MAG: hypothetical protein DRJ13_02205 [Bacteroidetes bacterium]|nr:MAG: hypothetical protein DRJ13_02205 [Bacteroidota bacterium]
MEIITIQSQWIENISILEFSMETAKPAPLVFFVHGVASDKRQGIPLGYEMARKGFVFVSLDAIQRGERSDQKFKPSDDGDWESIYPEETWLDGLFTMIRMIRQIGLDLQVLIDHYQDDSRLDGEKIGFAGYSMGGWAAFYSSSINQHIKATASIGGAPCFERIWENVVLECSVNQDWTEHLDKVKEGTSLRKAYIRDLDPFFYFTEKKINPLLMVCGDLDPGPKKYCLDLYGKINQKSQSKTDNLKMSIHDGVGHQLTLQMAEETAAWFEEIFNY